MSGRYTPVLEELRRERGMLDQAIVALEHLNGERPMLPASSASTYTAVADVRPQKQKLLSAAAAKRRGGRRPKSPKVEVRYDTRGGKAAPPVRSAAPPVVGSRAARNNGDDEAVLRAVKSLVSATRDQVMKETGMDKGRVTKAKLRLEASGRLDVKGRARAARWSLPATKEAP